MIKIATRKKDPISASRICNACLWFYSMPGQIKKGENGIEREYMRGLARLIKGEGFAVYLDRGPYDFTMTGEDERRAEWELRAKWVNDNEGEWPSSAPDPKTCPQEFRELFDEKYWRILGWK